MTTTLSRPPLVVRVAVSGHRDFGDVQGIGEHLQAQVESVLSVVKPSVDKIYEQDAKMEDGGLYDHGIPPQLRLVSGLAAGADQLAAERALAAGWRLEAVLPFTIDEFRQDFGTAEAPTCYGKELGLKRGDGREWPDDRAAFDDLLVKAGPACIELCGATEPDGLRNRSYLAVGQTLVRRCEVLVAIWNGSEAKGKGGTADVVEFALRNRVPVIWINAAGQHETCWLMDVKDFYLVLQERKPPKSEQKLPVFTDDLLMEYLSNLLLISNNGDGDQVKKAVLNSGNSNGYSSGEHPKLHSGWRVFAAIEKIKRLIAWFLEKITGIMSRYDCSYVFSEFLKDLVHDCNNRPCKPEFYHGLFRTLRGWIVGNVKPDEKENDSASGNLLEQYFLDWFIPVDKCANAYSDGYRSTYTAIFLLGALAIISAILGAANVHAAVWVEFPALIGIFLLYHRERKYNRHRRWIANRLFSELLRHSRWLSLLGREMNLGRNELKDEERRPEESWLLPCLQAMIRAAPRVPLRLDADNLGQLQERVRTRLLKVQIDYHELNANRSGMVAERLGTSAIVLFVLTVVIVGIEVLMALLHVYPNHPWNAVLPTLAGAIPTFVAATAAFRQQSEFELLEKTSELMHKALKHADQRLKDIDCTQPWAAEQIGEELVRVADLMTADVADWSLVFQVKAVDLT